MGPLDLTRAEGVLTLPGSQFCPPPPPGAGGSGYRDCRLARSGRVGGGFPEAILDHRTEPSGSLSTLPAVAKKNLLVLKGGLAVSFLKIRLMEIAFLLSINFYH
jgi:hypothetical protein